MTVEAQLNLIIPGVGAALAVLLAIAQGRQFRVNRHARRTAEAATVLTHLTSSVDDPDERTAEELRRIVSHHASEYSLQHKIRYRDVLDAVMTALFAVGSFSAGIRIWIDGTLAGSPSELFGKCLAAIFFAGGVLFAGNAIGHVSRPGKRN